MRLVRTQFAYEEIIAHLAGSGADPLIENYFVQFLLVSFYAEVEEVIKNVVSNRLSNIRDEQVAHFILQTNEAMIRRIKKSEINDILQKFKCGDGDILAREGGDFNFQPYFDAITNRHLVSHGEGASMTLDGFSKALPCAEFIFDVVERLLCPSDGQEATASQAETGEMAATV
jgi:hypothetical protein